MTIEIEPTALYDPNTVQHIEQVPSVLGDTAIRAFGHEEHSVPDLLADDALLPEQTTWLRETWAREQLARNQAGSSGKRPGRANSTGLRVLLG